MNIAGRTVKDNPGLKDLQPLFELTLTRRNTWTQYSRFISKIVGFLGPNRKPMDVFRMDVEALREWLLKEGYAKSTVNTHMIAMSSFYTWMKHYDIVDADFNPFRPALHIKKNYSYVGAETPRV